MLSNEHLCDSCKFQKIWFDDVQNVFKSQCTNFKMWQSANTLVLACICYENKDSIKKEQFEQINLEDLK